MRVIRNGVSAMFLFIVIAAAIAFAAVLGSVSIEDAVRFPR